MENETRALLIDKDAFTEGACKPAEEQFAEHALLRTIAITEEFIERLHKEFIKEEPERTEKG